MDPVSRALLSSAMNKQLLSAMDSEFKAVIETHRNDLACFANGIEHVRHAYPMR